jgi:hypothetical protein
MLNEIFKISDYPYLQPDTNFTDKLVRLVKTYGWLFLALLAIGPILLLADKFVTDVLHHKSLAAHNRQLFKELHKKLGFVDSLLLICLAGPFFEEMIFRFPLTLKKRNVIISGLIALFYFSSILFNVKVAGILLLSEIPFVGIGCLLVWRLVPVAPLNVSAAGKRRFIIASICLFGLMHISNFRPLDTALLWIYPIYVIPQLLMGWAISYTRLKNGFAWGLALHCLINTVATVLSFKYK